MRDGIKDSGIPSRDLVVLVRGEVMGFQSEGQSCSVTCLAGRVWATIEGDPSDYVLRAGETVSLDRRGKIVVQALEAAAFSFETAARANAVSAPGNPLTTPILGVD